MNTQELGRTISSRPVQTFPAPPSNNRANALEISRKRDSGSWRTTLRTGIPVERPVAARPVPGVRRFLRRSFDTMCAAAGLVVLSPVLAIIAIAIKLSDGGPVLYSHIRIGKDLRRFRFLKFRTMVTTSAEGSPVTAPADPRVTRFGRFLRRYKLDELPQLVNVLKGEMQLVGVRPQLEKHVELFRAEYEELLQCPPGITDLATLIFRREELLFHEGSIEEQYVKKIMPVKLQIALNYSRNRTFVSDLEIIFRTVLGLGAPPATWRGAKFDPVLRSLSSLVSRNSS